MKVSETITDTISQTNTVVFQLLKSALFQKELSLPFDVDWKTVVQEMRAQTEIDVNIRNKWHCNFRTFIMQ